MKRKNLFIIAAILALSLLLLTSCGKKTTQETDEGEDFYYVEVEKPELIPIPEGNCGNAYLYGEEHANGFYVQKELELWQHYYNDNGMRHLFVELPYYAAQSLNLWMQADNDEILDTFFADFSGTNAGTPVMRSFYQVIKETCPETIFHGTDVGRSDDEAGKHYLAYLEDLKMKKSEEYAIAQNSMAQGDYFMREAFFNDDLYREEMMAYNFTSALASLDGEDIMGIYGAAHIDSTRHDDAEQNRMLARLLDEYHLSVTAEDLRGEENAQLAPMLIYIDGVEYEADFMGETVSAVDGNLQLQSFLYVWGAGEDFENAQTTGKTVLSNEFPGEVESQELYAILTPSQDGGVEYEYYLATEKVENDALILNQIVVE